MKDFLTITGSEARELVKEVDKNWEMVNKVNGLIFTREEAERLLELIEISFVPQRIKKKIYEFVYQDKEFARSSA